VVEAKSRRGRYYTGVITHILGKGAESKKGYQVQVSANIPTDERRASETAAEEEALLESRLTRVSLRMHSYHVFWTSSHVLG